MIYDLNMASLESKRLERPSVNNFDLTMYIKSEYLKTVIPNLYRK